MEKLRGGRAREVEEKDVSTTYAEIVSLSVHYNFSFKPDINCLIITLSELLKALFFRSKARTTLQV